MLTLSGTLTLIVSLIRIAVSGSDIYAGGSFTNIGASQIIWHYICQTEQTMEMLIPPGIREEMVISPLCKYHHH